MSVELYKADIARLQQELAAAKTDAGPTPSRRPDPAQAAEIARLATENDRLTARLAQAAAAAAAGIESVRKELASDRRAALAQQRSEFERVVAAREAMVRDAGDAARAARQEALAALEQVELQKGEIGRLRSRLADSTKVAAAKAEAARDAAAADLARLKRRLADAERTAREAGADSPMPKPAVADSGLRAERDELAAALRSVRAQLGASTRKVAALEASVAAHEARAAAMGIGENPETE